jgi:type I restriction enzyme S subunit
MGNISGLPPGWDTVKFVEACDKIPLTGIKVKQKQYLPSGKYPVIDQGQEVVGGFFDNENLVVPDEPPYIIFGDHTKVKKYINFKFIAGADGIKVLKPVEFFHPKLFFYFIHCIKVPDKGYARHFQFLEKTELPLPPFPEQARIVAKIEELFSEIDKGVENFTTAREQLKIYRQALLKHAFEGKLTEQWRKTNADKLEPAEQILVRIKEERETRYQEQVIEWEKAVEEWQANGKKDEKPVKPRKLKELPPLTTADIKALPALPNSWTWTKADQIHSHEQNAIKAGPFGSSLKKEMYVSSGYKIYGQEQVISGDWEFGDYYIDDQKYHELENCKVQPYDILISLVGTVGKVLVLPDRMQPGIINPRLIKISPNLTAYNPYFLKYYFESSLLRDLYKLKTHGATMDVLNLGIIQELPFPICSIDEQHEIVSRLEAGISEIEQLEKSIESELIKANALKQATLIKAFSGQLVPQDPNDEPASILLERIRAEREAAKQEEKRGVRKKGKKIKEVITMADLMEVLKTKKDWMSAQEAFRRCGIADGSETDDIEKIYVELRDHVKAHRISVKRKGNEDWLRVAQGV